MVDICSTQVCGALWSLLKGRSQLGSYENYALQSFTVFEGSDPPAGLARFKVSRETALCKETRNSVSNWSYCNKWKIVFQIPVADVQCLPHTHTCCAACAHSNCKARVQESQTTQHLRSTSGLVYGRCWLAMYICLKRNVFKCAFNNFLPPDSILCLKMCPNFS